MMWPLVSRVALAQAQQARADAMVALEVERARYDTLLAGYIALSSPKPVATVGGAPLELVRQSPSPVDVVIREQAGSDVALASHLRKYARELKTQGMNEDQIVGKLVQWETSEPSDQSATG